MSSLTSGASPTSIDTQLPRTATFLNASSTANGAPDISPLPSSSIIISDPTQELLTSSKDALDVAPNTTQSSPTQTLSITNPLFSAEETVGISPTTVAQGESTADAEPALPTTTSQGNQADPTAPAETSSFAEEPSPQPVTLITVSTSKTPVATPSNQPPPSVTIPSQSSAAGTKIAQKISSTPAKSTSITPPQATPAAAAQPTDDSTQEPQVFSAESVDAPAGTSALSSTPAASPAEAPSSTVATPSLIPASPAASTGGNGSSSSQEPPPIAPTGPVNQAVSESVESSASTASISVTSSNLIPASASISGLTPDSAATSAPPSATTSTPVPVTSVPLSDSVLSGTSSTAGTDAMTTTRGFAGGIAAFPTASSTLPGDLPGSSLSAGGQPTGQPIQDPVGSSSKPSTGSIVGGTVGGVAAVAFILILLWLWKRRAVNDRQGSSREGGLTEKGSFKSMAQRIGFSTALNAVRQNLGEKLGSRNVNMDRGNSQFLEAAISEPSNVTRPPHPLSQHPVTQDDKPNDVRKGQGMSLEPSKLNPFSDANALMPGTVPPPSSSSLVNPFGDDNMVLPPPVTASKRRSRGLSLGGIGNLQVSRGPPRPHSVHRESLHGRESLNQNRESFLQRRDKCRSDPFDLELQTTHLFPPGTAVSTRASSVYSNSHRPNSHDSYTSRYVSGSSLGDWGGVREDPVAHEGRVERVDSPTIA
ncbi:hypothetical protein J3F83DRAFT_669625 [Trichoderma novae-zelandiae]